ncbi:hypothetical protein WJR50_09360 [Catalinimonas sp. 4WD22]|uniref:hypothetical protein n=1 Tax=Catalinimonas locisalis TaxID=3133978 RepID=UPI003100C188
MDKKILVGIDLEEGKKVLEELDKSGLEVTSAFWFYLAEVEEWRLMLAMPSIDIQGRKKTYAKIWGVLDRNRSTLNIPLDAITLISPKHELNQLLRSVVKTGKSMSGIRFSGDVINGTLIEDAYIYRVN